MNVTLRGVAVALAGLTDSSKEYPVHSVIAGEAGLQEKEGQSVSVFLKRALCRYRTTCGFAIM